MPSIEPLTLNYEERMRRLALFEPLYELDQATRKDEKGQPIPMKDLGLLTLLFFFEHRLMRNQKVSASHLAKFLYETTNERLTLDEEKYLPIARDIILKFRPSGGKRTISYYNWETKVQQSHQFSFLRDNDFEKGVQYYTLDEDGLELVFATREFYSEFQLSIHQLMLRKQLEKGEFKGALRQMNEMFIEVERLNERMQKVAMEIKRNIVSGETFKRYEQLLDDIYSRLARENEEFDELTSFVKETQDHLYYEEMEEAEQTAYEYILEIAKELERVHGEHGALLHQCMELKNTALKAAHDSLYYSGVASFNFEQDITARLLTAPISLQGLKGISAPFTSLEQVEAWSPLTIFEQQLVGQSDAEEKTTTFLQIDPEEEKLQYASVQNAFYGKVATLLCRYFEQVGVFTLSDFIAQLEDQTLLDNRLFYECLLVLHQRSPLVEKVQDGDDEAAEYALSSVFNVLKRRTLMVTEVAEILQVTKRYSIQQFQFELKGVVDDA